MADAPNTEHPAAKRMRENFEAQYGDMHPIALALRRYYNARSAYSDGWNRLSEKPTTEADVDAAEQEVFAAVRAFAATPSPPVAAVPATPVASPIGWALRNAVEVNSRWRQIARVRHDVEHEDHHYMAQWAYERGWADAAQPQPQPAQPLTGARQDAVLVPRKFIQGFSDLAHNYQLEAVPPDYYHGVERDAFKDAYRRCGDDLKRLRDILAAPSTPTPPTGDPS